MSELKQYIDIILSAGADRIIISGPFSKTEQYKKITADRKPGGFQIAKYTEKQVFHENLKEEELSARLDGLAGGKYKQINGFSASAEHIVLGNRNGSYGYKVRKLADETIRPGGAPASHNREKNYILKEGVSIAPLADMGVFTADGRVVSSMYDKYKQLNRFLEIINDELKNRKPGKLRVIDFGCGKSYLTFVVYYYLTEIMGFDVSMTGLDLKADVIKHCNAAAEKYGYDGLHFELGDINGYVFDKADMVITLHACDTATDYALYNAVQRNAEMIFSVPCCQHELNSQMKPENLALLSRYGIIKERFSALATDAIRGALLEYRGYKTQLIEFVDFEHTPKNIMIRAVKRPVTPKKLADTALKEAETLMKEFSFQPALYRLLVEKENEEK